MGLVQGWQHPDWWNKFCPLVFTECLNFTATCHHSYHRLLVYSVQCEALADCTAWTAREFTKIWHHGSDTGFESHPPITLIVGSLLDWYHTGSRRTLSGATRFHFRGHGCRLVCSGQKEHHVVAQAVCIRVNSEPNSLNSTPFICRQNNARNLQRTQMNSSSV